MTYKTSESGEETGEKVRPHQLWQPRREGLRDRVKLQGDGSRKDGGKTSDARLWVTGQSSFFPIEGTL